MRSAASSGSTPRVASASAVERGAFLVPSGQHLARVAVEVVVLAIARVAALIGRPRRARARPVLAGCAPRGSAGTGPRGHDLTHQRQRDAAVEHTEPAEHRGLFLVEQRVRAARHRSHLVVAGDDELVDVVDQVAGRDHGELRRHELERQRQPSAATYQCRDVRCERAVDIEPATGLADAIGEQGDLHVVEQRANVRIAGLGQRLDRHDDFAVDAQRDAGSDDQRELRARRHEVGRE